MALLYTAPRSATITAQDDSEVWSLDRTAFRNLVVRSSEAQFKEPFPFEKGEVLWVLDDVFFLGQTFWKSKSFNF